MADQTDKSPGSGDSGVPDLDDSGDLAAAALRPALLGLFDELVNVMFCVKGLDGCYVAVNPAFVRRSGRSSRRDVIGRRASELFPPLLADRYEEQDAAVFASGAPLRDELELIRRPDDSFGWYLTSKLPVIDNDAVVGLVSVSRDLETPSDSGMESLGRVVALVRQRLNEAPKVAELAAAAGCSEPQLERRMKRVFGLTANQYVLRVRVDRARELLTTTTTPIASIASDVGFYDQASFTRQFARLAGETPAQFRSQWSRVIT